MFAQILLALALGQGCPEPLPPYDAPPCAAVNVPGCLPGYLPTRDWYGRVVYACRSYGQPAPEATAAGPQAAPRPAPGYATPPPQEWPPALPPEHAGPARPPARGRLALMLLPGVTSGLGERWRRPDREVGAVAVELREARGGGRARLALQYAEFGRVAELAFKYDFFDRFPVRPFVGLGLGAASVNPESGWRVSGSVLGGVDVYLSRNVFLTGELQARRFARHGPGPARGLELAGFRQAAALVGMGLYL